MLEGIPGARAFDEVLEQGGLVKQRNLNGGKPPQPRIVLTPPSTPEFRSRVLQALGVGKNVVLEA
ncbi:MAG: hypothetical protein D6679_08195 [Candidatus Hydrogenedentota bacterium]|nr:MAG: hypothetical protein D6679_08195 [Candidatus Hydrogenedentota bacterium]